MTRQRGSGVPDDSTTPLNAASGLPVAPSLAPALATVEAPPDYAPVDRRVVVVATIALFVGIGAALLANVLTRLIGLITNVAYYGRVSTAFVSPSIVRSGAWSILIPLVGAFVVGLMARYGAAAIRGHGIPEVMERVLYARSRIAPRIMFLKPLSASRRCGSPVSCIGSRICTRSCRFTGCGGRSLARSSSVSSAISSRVRLASATPTSTPFSLGTLWAAR